MQWTPSLTRKPCVPFGVGSRTVASTGFVPGLCMFFADGCGNPCLLRPSALLKQAHRERFCDTSRMATLRTSRAADRLRRSKLRHLVYGWRHRGLKPADVMLASYPRSGNSWTKLMLAELLAGSGEVNSSSKQWLVPAVGEHLQSPRLLPGDGRLIKTHEPYHKVYRRAIYLVRYVRPVAVSFRELYSPEACAQLHRTAFELALAS
jgi:hypothetical protein